MLAEFAATYSTDHRPQSDDVNNDALDVESETNTGQQNTSYGWFWVHAWEEETSYHKIQKV